jgi:flagellar motility protein MotE (MotC chaperone)
MKLKFQWCGLVQRACFGLSAAIGLAVVSTYETKADQGWTPVIVSSANSGPARQAASSRPAPADDRAPRMAKASPMEAVPARQQELLPAMPPAEPPVRSAEVGPERAKPAQQPGSAGGEAAPERTQKAMDAGAAEASAAQQYCANIADAAADARFAWQKKTLAEIQHELDKRIARLEAKTAEFQSWLARRDEFSKKAHEGLVKIYSSMRPDAAASQLVAMDEETAAAVLTKLNPRNASAILNEMPAAQAARLTGTIAGAARVTPDKTKS